MDSGMQFPVGGPGDENLLPPTDKKIPKKDDLKGVFQRAVGDASPTQGIKIQLGKKKAVAASPDPLENCSPAMKERLHVAEQALDRATTATTLKERLSYTPQIPGAKGIGGSYFVGQVGDPVLLIKPVVQEPGMAGSDEEASYTAVRPGTGAIRERMAYRVQEALGISFGVPETTLHAFSHEMLEIASDTTKNLKFLKSISGVTSTRAQVADLIEHSPDGTFSSAYAALLEQKLTKLVPNPATRNKILDFAKNDQLTLADIRRTIPNKDLAKIVYGLSQLVKQKEAVETAAMSIYASLSAPTTPSGSPQLCSAQAVEKGCISLDTIALMDDTRELQLIPQRELEKLIFDCIVFNLDRHLGNVLARKQTVDQIQERIHGAAPEEKERLESQLLHAQTTQSPYIYELILIDHATSFPEVDFAGAVAKMDWSRFDQSKQKISEYTKNRLLTFDPATLVAKLKEDQKQYEARFGQLCRVTDQAFEFMRYSCMVLQEALRQDKTMYQLSELYEIEESGFLALYTQEILGKGSVDWEYVQNKIKTLVAGE